MQVMCSQTWDLTMWSRALVFAMISVISSASRSESFFVMTDEEGTLHVAKRRLTSDYVQMMSSGRVLIRASMVERKAWRAKLRPAIADAATKHGVAVELIDAIILAESGYDPNAVSNKGAMGLMQLMPLTAKFYGVKDRSDPAANIAGGVAYLKSLLTRYEKVDVAIAAYNAGETAVDRAGGIPDYPETREYVARVLTIIGRGM
jgi:membrane-bound lytic murein transglycosylase MltF